MNVENAWLKWCTPFVIAMMTMASSQVFARGNENVVTTNDADGDRVVDTVDVDDDNDGITDIFEIASNGQDVDTDKDGIPDRLDLDSDNDGILDWQESGAVLSIDFSSLRVVSGRLLGPVGENGFIDALETSLDNGQMAYSLANTDYPEDDLPDAIDLDSDNDGLPDLQEAGVDASLDNDRDARIDIDTGSVGNDGIADRIQNTNDETCCDVTGDGIEDIVPRNTDFTDYPDFQDLDSDNDGVFDLIETGGLDFDGNGRVDNFFDSPVLDGMDDTILSIPLVSTDNNGNAVPDHIDEFAQSGGVGTGVPAGNNNGNTEVGSPIVVTNPDAGTAERTPATRPGTNILPTDSNQPAEDDPAGGLIQTGLNASGCSVQSAGFDLLLLLLSVLSMTVLGWRYTIRRMRH